MSSRVRHHAARIITTFMRRIHRGWFSNAPVRFSNQFFVNSTTCCDIYRLVRFYVRVSCVDEMLDVTPRCVVNNTVVDGSTLLFLCRRTTTHAEWDTICALLEYMNRSDTPVPTQSDATKTLFYIMSTMKSIGGVLLFRLGWEAVKQQRWKTPANLPCHVAKKKMT